MDTFSGDTKFQEHFIVKQLTLLHLKEQKVKEITTDDRLFWFEIILVHLPYPGRLHADEALLA